MARHLQLLIPQLMKRGLSCGLFGFGARIGDDFRRMSAASGCFVELMPSGGFALMAARRCIDAIVRKCSPGVIHLHAFRAGVAGRLSSHGCPVVYSPHAFGFHRPQPFWRRYAARVVERHFAPRTDCYVLLGASEVDDAHSIGVDDRHIRIIPNGLPTDFASTLLPRSEARRVLGIPLEASAVVAPCRLEPQKGLEALIDAFALLESPPQLYICGGGSLAPRLRCRIGRASLGGCVHLTGEVRGLPGLLSAFDFAVLPSFYEGLSYALLELLAAGIPLAVSDIAANFPVPGLRNYVVRFTPGRPREIARALASMLRAPECARENARAARALAAFPLDSQADALAGLYRALSGGGMA